MFVSTQKNTAYVALIMERILELNEEIRSTTSPSFKSESFRGLWEEFQNAALKLAEANLIPTHGDMSYKNFLLTDHRIFLIDWDELMLADPMRDIRGFAHQLTSKPTVAHYATVGLLVGPKGLEPHNAVARRDPTSP